MVSKTSASASVRVFPTSHVRSAARSNACDSIWSAVALIISTRFFQPARSHSGKAVFAA